MDLKIDGHDAWGQFVSVLEMLVLFGLLMEGHNNQKTVDFLAEGCLIFN